MLDQFIKSKPQVPISRGLHLTSVGVSAQTAKAGASIGTSPADQVGIVLQAARLPEPA